MKRDLHGKRVLLDHKIAARDLAISTADETFVGWTLGAQRSEVTASPSSMTFADLLGLRKHDPQRRIEELASV